jgi:hypothetical protein
MTPDLIPLVLDVYDGQGNPVVAGTATLTPSVMLTDPGSGLVIESGPVVTFRPGSAPPLTQLIPTDASGLTPSGWSWQITFTGVSASPSSWFFDLTGAAGVLSFTATSASPAVFTASGSAFTNGQAVALAGSSLPGGFADNLVYYVTGASGDTFSLAATSGGSALASTSAGSGTVAAVQYLSSLSPEQAPVTVVSYAQVDAGDLDGPGGTSASPKVSGLQGVAVASTAPSSGQVLEYNGSQWAPGNAGSGTVTSVTAGDASIVVSGTGAAPVLEAGTLDEIATLHPPAASVPMNGQKLTGLGNGSASGDSAAYGQLPSSSSPLALSKGGTGLSEATAAALVTALGALLASNNLSDLAARQTALNNLAGAVTSGDYLRGNGTNVAMAAIQSADLPSGSTSAKGALQLDGTSSDIQPAQQSASAGTGSLAAISTHVHPPGSSYLCTPAIYAPGSQTILPVSTTTFTAFSSSNVNTGAFTAPPSGAVVVTASFIITMPTASIAMSFGLSAHGNTGTIYGSIYTGMISSTNIHQFGPLVWYITSLTPGTSYTMDLVGATSNASDPVEIVAFGTTTPSSTLGGPVTMTVQAV